MASIKDRKSDFYSHKQSVRDESCAPQFLESAGDVLIKDLARKQLETSISLKQQLEIVQNFEKGFELNPENQKGITSLEDFKKQTEEISPPKSEEPPTKEELTKICGLSRHELKITLSEKPNSDISKLYMFAVGNKSKRKGETLEEQLPDHPINHLKEIEEEYFGHLKKKKSKQRKELTGDHQHNEKEREKAKSKKKHRKRRKKCQKEDNKASNVEKSRDAFESVEKPPLESERDAVGCSRPSLWDVKDMKKWCESKKYGCEPQKLYTIKDGKIIKLDSGRSAEDNR